MMTAAARKTEEGGMIVGEAFRIARRRRGMTPEQIAARVDGSPNEVSVRTIYLIETKETTPSLDTVRGLAEAYGMDWIDLYLELFSILRSAEIKIDGHGLSEEGLTLSYIHDSLSPARRQALMDFAEALRKAESLASGQS